MGMSKGQAEAFMVRLIGKISELFYDGGAFTAIGMTVVPRLVVEDEATSFNGNLTPVGGGLGVAISDLLLQVGTENGIKFALGHELGHAFSEHLLNRIGLGGIGGSPTEVIADLGSAHVLSHLGLPWGTILSLMDHWQDAGVFDPGRSGDHPPGALRAVYVKSLYSLLSAGHSFEDSAKGICMSLQGQ